MGCGYSKPSVVGDPLPSPKYKSSRHSSERFSEKQLDCSKNEDRHSRRHHYHHHHQQQQHQQQQQQLLQQQYGQRSSSIRNDTSEFGNAPSLNRRKDVGHLENPRLGNLPKHQEGEQVAAGWPAWLSAVAGEAIRGWIPRRADSFEKLDKIGQGTYSNVYKARDLESRKIVALKKVRFDNLEPESVKFMAREILVLRRLDHPNVVKLEGLVTSRMSCSLYLVFEYMEHDLAGLAACPGIKFTEPQVKCYLRQLILGLHHCHSRGVLHRDIKGSNLLIDNNGLLKIADFGLATFFCPEQNQPLTSRVVTLWYRPPELLLGATEYGVGIDLWSTGCILAELLAGKPIMPGRTEVEQLHKIFKLCGSPSEEYWKKSKLPHATIFKPQQPYKRCINETFKDFPASSLALLDKLLAIEPKERGTAADALKSEFFTTKPYACDPSSLPQYPPSKEMDAKLRDEENRRLRSLAAGKSRADSSRRVTTRDYKSKAVPAPEANAELPENIQKRRNASQHSNRSKSEKFPHSHIDSSVGFLAEPPRDSQISAEKLNHSFVQMPQHIESSSLAPHSSFMGIHRRKQNSRGDAPASRPVSRVAKSMSISEITCQNEDLFRSSGQDVLARASQKDGQAQQPYCRWDSFVEGENDINGVHRSKRMGQFDAGNAFGSSRGSLASAMKDGHRAVRLSSFAN